MNRKTLGTFIAAKRKEKGLTQKQIAEMLGVSDKTVSHWEREESYPDISLLPVLADIFGITADELLRCEEKDAVSQQAEKEKSGSSAAEYLTNSIYSKFKARSFISIAAAVIALLAYFLVEYYKTVTFAFLVFLTLLVIPVFLAVFFRASLSSHLTSPYTDKQQARLLALKANRITVNCLYFAFLCFVITGIATMSFSVPEEAEIAFCVIAAVGTAVACEAVLRKHGILKASDKPIKVKKKFTLKILCIFACVILLFCGYVSHASISRGSILHEKADYTSVETEQELIELMERDTAAPEEISNTSFTEFTPADYGTEFSYCYWMGTGISAMDPELNVTYIYRNRQIAAVRNIDGGFQVYSHSQLIEGEKETDKAVTVLVIFHFVYYFAVILLTLGAYKLIKKKIDKVN